jgi:hypothetical protein
VQQFEEIRANDARVRFVRRFSVAHELNSRGAQTQESWRVVSDSVGLARVLAPATMQAFAAYVEGME